MKRDELRRIAAETVEILERGRYSASTGETVDVSAALSHAVRLSRVLSPTVAAAMGRRWSGERSVPVELSSETTLAAAADLLAGAPGAHVGVLNFASARSPGGGFLNGADAQEESLARASGLYRALLAAEGYYQANRAAESALYTDAMIVSPKTPFFRSDGGELLEAPRYLTVFTAPAPNVGALRTEAERAAAPDVLKRRMDAVLGVAAEMAVDALVLGAWGCGVFRNDPSQVARLWSAALGSAPEGAKPDHVRMAVFDPSPAKTTLRAFEAVFGPARPGPSP